YHYIGIKYNYGTWELPVAQDFYLDGPKERAPYGVGCFTNEKTGAKKYGVSSRIDPSNPEHKAYLEVWRQIYVAAVLYLFSIKGSVRLGGLRINPDDTASLTYENILTEVKYPITYRRDKTSGVLIPGARHTVSYKVQIGNKRTLFTDSSIPPKEVKRELLEVAEFDFYALNHIYAFTVTGSGPTASISHIMLSAIVKDPVPRSTTTYQTNRIQTLNKENPEMSQMLEKQIEAITATMAYNEQFSKKTDEPKKTNAAIDPPPQPQQPSHPPPPQHYQPPPQHYYPRQPAPPNPGFHHMAGYSNTPQGVFNLPQPP